MDYLPQILLFSCAFVAIYFWLKPRAKPKSTPQKQEEIRQMYRQRLQTELSSIQNDDERQIKKVDLLKTFAKELEFNLFFDKDEVKVLIQELAKY